MKAKGLVLLGWVASGLIAAAAVQAQTVLYVAQEEADTPIQAIEAARTVRVSVKVVLDDFGSRPRSGYYRDDAQISGAISEANTALAGMGADWRLSLTEIVEVSGGGQWFDMACNDKGALELAAEASPAQYGWRLDAINIYVVNDLAGCGGYGSYPYGNDDIIVVQSVQGILNFGIGWLHEIGHYFGLVHTYQCSPMPCESDIAVCTGGGGLRRGCPDVCPDANNVMGYHETLLPRDAVFSRCQLDIIAVEMDLGSGARANVVSQRRHAPTDLIPAPGAGDGTVCETPSGHADQPDPSPVVAAPAPTPIRLLLDENDPLLTRVSNPLAAVTYEAESGEAQTPEWFDEALVDVVLSEVKAETPTGLDPIPQDGPAAVEAQCSDETVDTTAPKVLSVVVNPAVADRVELVVTFSEPILTREIDNGFDLTVRRDGQVVSGSIAWSEDGSELTWTPNLPLEPGTYEMQLAGSDSSDFQDKSGNLLEGVGIDGPGGDFHLEFVVDRAGEVAPSATAPACPEICGVGICLPFGFVSLMFLRNRRR